MTESVEIAVIGTGDSGLKDNTKATTPGTQPNILITVISPLMAIGIRFGNLYLTLFTALVVSGMATNLVPATDFAHMLLVCAKLSVSGAVVGLLKDLVTVFGKLEGKYPLLTGSV